MTNKASKSLLRPYVPLSLRPSRGAASRSFTLVELIVVIGIISILVVSVLPILGALYRDTQGADAANRLQGLLKSARMRAVGGFESGLFFFIEPGTNTQKVVFIQADPPDYTPLPHIRSDGTPWPSPDLGRNEVRDSAAGGVNDDVEQQDAVDRFRVLEGNVFDIPPPFRVAPLDLLDPAGEWSDEEIANDDYENTALTFGASNAGPQNHRSFFTVIFGRQGRLVAQRDVLIHDRRPPPTSDSAPAQYYFEQGRGAITLLPVVAAGQREARDGQPDYFPSSDDVELAGMVYADEGGSPVALNFPSVAGLLVYDDSLLGEFPISDDSDPDVVDQRDFLRERGQPIYISPQTGAIIRGPVGEDST